MTYKYYNIDYNTCILLFQADVCHAYQILKQHGVDDDHIIVMMMDDIAHNTMYVDFIFKYVYLFYFSNSKLLR